MNRGQVLNEAVIAMGIITVTVIGSFGLMAKAIGYNRFISDQSTAVHLAAEGAEITKNILDSKVYDAVGNPTGYAWSIIQPLAGKCYEVDYQSSNLDTVTPNPQRYLSLIDGFYVYSNAKINLTSFQRSVCVLALGTDEIQIASTVTYKARNGLLNKVDVSTSIFNWR